MISQSPKVGVIIPTYNPGESLRKCIEPMLEPALGLSILVVDSSSTDGTFDLVRSMNIPMIVIPKNEFNHGGTRQKALTKLIDCDIVIFLTQDSIPKSSDVFKKIILPFSDPQIAAVCGRQLPSKYASPIATHARLFNYPDCSNIRSLQDVPQLGIKAAFMSNSFAAYRISSLKEVGGFSSDVIFGEDMLVAAKLLLNGWKIAYKSDAIVYHSHNYTIFQEFKRYFDVGVLHLRQRWLIESFGKPEGEGIKFMLAELKYLIKDAPIYIPESILRTGVKYLGYRLGKLEWRLSNKFKKLVSMNKAYWE